MYVWGNRSRRRSVHRPGDGLYTVPVTSQNEAETEDTEGYPDDERTGRDQEGRS